MKVKFVSLTGAAASGELSLSKAVFGLELRKDILHRVVNWQLAKRQAGTHKVKSVGEVRGSTAKPFKQKGTGNARQGTKYAPQMRGGATVHGPVVRSHSHSLNKKIRSLGLKIALSSKQASGDLIVIKDDKVGSVKTSDVAKGLKAIDVKSALIIGGEIVNDNLKKAVSNVREVDLLPVQGINVYDILRRKKLILTEDAIKNLEARLNG